MKHVTIDREAATESRADFLINRAEFAKALAFLAKHFAKARNTLPILSNALIEAGPGGVRIVSTDLDAMAELILPADVSAPGRFTIPAATLADNLKKADSDRVCIRDRGDGQARVASGRTAFNVPTLPADDFPIIATPPGGKAFTLPAEWARDMAAVAPCMSKEEHRYYLGGVALQCSNGRMFMVTADGPNMAAIDRPAPLGMAGMDDVVIPRQTVAAMLAWVKDAKATGPLSLDMGASRFRAELPGGLVLTSKLINRTFPQWGDMLHALDFGEPRAVSIPFLEPGLRLDTLTALEKATGKALSVEIGGQDCLLTCPDYPEFFAVSRLASDAMPKGFSHRTHDGEERRAIDYLRQLCLDAGISGHGLTETRTHWLHGAELPTIQGVTFGAISQRAESTSRDVETVDWETLTTKTETVYSHTPAQYQEGSFTAIMPGAAAFDHRACTMEVMDDSGAWSEKVWIAQDAKGAIALTADQVRHVAGEVEAAPVHIPVATVWRGQIVALDGVPTEKMPEGYALAIVPTGKEAKALRAKMAGMCIKNQAREIAAIAARFNPVRLAMPGELESPSAAQEPEQEAPAPAPVESEAPRYTFPDSYMDAAEGLPAQAQQALEAPIAPPEPVEASSEPEIGQDGAAIAAETTEIAFNAWLTAQFGVWIIAGRQSAKMTEAGRRAFTPRQYAKLRAQWGRGDIAGMEAAPPAPPLEEKGAADMAAQIAELMARVAALEGVDGCQNHENFANGCADDAATKCENHNHLSTKRTRTAAHTRLLMRYLAMRKERERDRSALLAGGDYCRRLSVELEQAKESLANAQAAGTRYRDQRIEADESARDWSRKEEKQRNRADRAERALVEAHTQAEILGKSLREASERALKAETALAAIEARANGWPPAAVSVKSVTFNARHAA